jgi:predicted nuclease with TOPRIM domain
LVILFIDNLTSRSKLQGKEGLMKTNQKLSFKLENFEERLSLEGSKLKILQDENSRLKEGLSSIRSEKTQLQELFDQNMVMLSKFTHFDFV